MSALGQWGSGNTCAKLGVPLVADKSEGPVTALVYLGIVIDTMAGELQLPDNKLPRLKTSPAMGN